MNVLGIDTSGPASAACVLRADGEAFEVAPEPAALAEPPAHARDLLPAIAKCMGDAGLGFGELDAIAVGVGPGMFTGLRVGVATAHGLAAAHGTELRSVSSLAALASQIDSEYALPLIDARRGEVFAALYEGERELLSPFAAAPGAVLERVRPLASNPLAAGDGSIRFRELLEEAGVQIAPAGSAAHVVRGLSICRLAATAAPAPPGAVLPDYVRLPDAKPRQER